ncbi:MAG: hypothetical protein K0B10_06535 [Vicingaceae bacterium]|nr:hypothetical protein [Vicingaceae bacterium]
MTTSLRHTIYFFLLLCIANIIAGIFNQTHNYTGSLIDVLESMPGLGMTSLIFWIGCQWKPHTKIRLFFLPILRTLFWTLIVVSGFWSKNRMSSEDFLYANNELFFWWTSLKIVTPTIRDYNVIVELALIDILSIAVGQLLLIYSAILLDSKIFNLKTKYIDNGI